MTTPGRWVALTTLTMAALTGCTALPQTALGQAALAGEITVLRERLAQGDRADEFDCRGLTALHWAARGGQAGAIRVLVEAGATVDLIDRRPTEWTPLMHAVHKGQEEAVAALLEAGASPDARSSTGRATALIMAAGYGQAGVVKRLLAAGADPYAQARDGVNALWSAAGGAAIADITDGPGFGTCQVEVIALLRSAAPDLRIPQSLSTSVLAALSRSAECSRLLKELIER